METTITLRARLEHLLTLVENSSNTDLQENVAWMIGNIPNSESSIVKSVLCYNKPKLSKLLTEMSSISRKRAKTVLVDYAKRVDLQGQVADVLLNIINFYE